MGIAIDGAGNVYVVEVGDDFFNNDRIQKFTSSGEFITKWGSGGSGDGEFSSPYGLSIGSAGYVYVADTDNDRIQKFTSSGEFITKWGVDGPTDIAIDGAGMFMWRMPVTTVSRSSPPRASS